MAEPIQFILESGGVKLVLPINPETYKTPYEINNTTVEVVELGEIIIPGSPRLSTRTLEGYFPAIRPESISAADFRTPMLYVNILRTWQATKAQILLTVTGLNQDNLLTIINSFEFEIRGGEHEDIYYTLELSEYRPYGALVIQLDEQTETVQPVQEQRTEETKPPVERTYNVVSGDSLWKITKQQSGDGARWRELYDTNKTVIGANPNLIYPGQIFKIPESWVTS